MEINPNEKTDLKSENNSKEITEAKEVTNVWTDIWDDIRDSFWVMLYTIVGASIIALIFNALDKAWGIYFWIAFVGIFTIVWQLAMTSTMFNIKEKSLWKIMLIVFFAIFEGQLAIFATTAILKTYSINKEIYIPVFFGVMVLMAIPPIWYISKHAKKNQEDAKYAYEIIKPVVNSFALVSTIYIFTARYFPNESAYETMPGFFMNPKTLPFYCYPWTLAFTFAEYFIKKKYPERKDKTKDDKAEEGEAT